MSAGAPRPSWYRPDVDGLRAVAVLLVVGFHAGLPGFGGGFVGVDVFFVISGFVIMALLLRELDARGTVSWSAFFARRIRRLLPAAAAMVVVVVGVAALLAPAWSDSRTVPLAGVAALTSTANFYYWWTWRDGFVPGALGVNEPTPLVHTWTLAVEEQLYLLLPLVGFVTLWVARGSIARGRMTPRSALLIVTAALGAASFALAWFATGRVEQGEFYLLPYRAFEFCFGIALALVGRSVRSLLLRVVLGLVGVTLLGLALAVPDWFGDYPGHAVLLPCLATVALILSRPAVLGLRPLVYLGTLSYGWYLWHVPVVELARAWNMGPVSDATVITLSLGALVPAALSHHFLETPLRRRSRRAIPTLAVGVGVVMTLSVASVGVGMSVAAQPQDVVRAPDSCRLHPADSMPRNGTRCRVTTFDSRRPTVVLRGDGQAWQLLPALLDQARERDVNVVAWVYPDCPPLDLSEARAWKFLNSYAQDSMEWGRWASCLVLNQQASRDIEKIAKRNVVLTVAAAQWPNHLADADDRTLAMLGRGTRGLVDRSRRDRPVALVAPIPQLPRSGQGCLTRWWRVTACDLERPIADSMLAPSTDWLHDIAGDRAPVVDLTDELCDVHSCSAGRAGAPSYLDPTHLTAGRVRLLAPAFEDVFAQLAQ